MSGNDTKDSEEWVTAPNAIILLKPVMSSQLAKETICARANDGMIRARAERFIRDRQVEDSVEIPSQFWWARGRAALEQNWRTGDFETWIDHSVQWKAYGVCFFRAQIEKMIPNPPSDASPAPHSLSPAVSPLSAPQQAQVSSRKVFLVHGHDEHAKNEVALFLRKIGLEEIILHQRPNRGRHLLTKFREEAEGAAFAVVLITPDDEGGVVGGPHQKRARQNVVFELGFFIGRLSTTHVAALVKTNIEKPSDFDGICWIDLDAAGTWKTLLARELSEAGVPFDPQQLLTA